MNTTRSLADYLDELQESGRIDADLVTLLQATASACGAIAGAIRQGALGNVLGSAGSENVQGETQKKLDVLSNDLMVERLAASGVVAGLASEEMEDPVIIDNGAARPYLALFDPLDGSSNIDVNISVGTIFSILRHPSPGTPPDTNAFLQSGSQQLCAGFTVYGPATVMVLTLGDGADAFTLNAESGEFLLTGQGITIPPDTKEFAINASNQRFWEEPVQRYIGECLAGVDGPRGKNFNMRWVASMVADVYRVLSRGGIFMYPKDNKDPTKPGKLRLMYEANPMSFIVEQAGGAASTARQRILEIQPEGLHQRVPVVLGSRNEVERVRDYHGLTE